MLAGKVSIVRHTGHYIYKEQEIELCKPRKVSSYICTRIPRVKRLMDKRNISMDQYAVAPVDLYKAI